MGQLDLIYVRRWITELEQMENYVNVGHEVNMKDTFIIQSKNKYIRHFIRNP